MATVYQEYAASSDLTVTNLHSIATSAGLLAGWTSNGVANTSDKHLDKVVSAKFVVGNSATAGQIQVWAYARLDDSNWPTSVFSAGTAGAQGTATIIDDEMKNGTFRLLWATATDADSGTDDTYHMPPTSVRAAFGGFLPAEFAVFVTHSTGVNLASSGNQVTVKGMYETIS